MPSHRWIAGSQGLLSAQVKFVVESRAWAYLMGTVDGFIGLQVAARTSHAKAWV